MFDFGSTANVYRALYPAYIESLQMFKCPALESDVTADGDGVHGGDYGIDVNIPSTADSARAVVADNGTLIHTRGSVVLFMDAHVEWCLHDSPYEGPNASNVVKNPNLPWDDSDIYVGPGWPDLVRSGSPGECHSDLNAVITPSQ